VIAEHKAYGHRRIALALGINHKRVRRVMRLFGLKARRGRYIISRKLELNVIYQAPIAIKIFLLKRL
jgi:hypothetical protein